MKNLNYIKTYSDDKCEEYDIFENDTYLGYYVKYFVNPMTEEKLENPVFEMYYDYSKDFDECVSSILADSLEECLEYLE